MTDTKGTRTAKPPGDAAHESSAPSPADEAQQAPQPEEGGPEGPEPTRFGDWERKGRCIDF